MEESSDPLQLQVLAGANNITQLTPIFSPDNSLLFVVSGKIVQIFSTSTGLSTRILKGANNTIISLEYDILDNEILVACTESGQVIYWKWSNGELKKTIQISIKGVPYKTFNPLNKFNYNDEQCAFITVKRETNMQYHLINLCTGEPMPNPTLFHLKRSPTIVDVNKGKFKYFVIIQGGNIYFVNYKNWIWKKLQNTWKTPFTCVKIHPTEELVATGDEVGRVILWRQFFQESQEVRMVLYHWHCTRVSTIAFTASGAGFYSGGLERVLVVWNIANPEKINFVPRMSSIIHQVVTSSDNSILAVATADNGIQILGPDLNTQCTLQEFTYSEDDKTQKERFPVGLKINPRKNTLVLNGRLGTLQFYSAYTRSMLYNVDIVNQNRIPLESDKILYNVRVTHVALNIDWMVTAEIFNDEQHLPEIGIKFWLYDEKIQRYTLNTMVEYAHEGGLKAIEFSNPYHVDNLRCATAGLDNVIKIWSLEDTNNIHRTGKVWYCIGETSYKNLPVESIAFSQDGSLLAAGFGNVLCIYKSENLKLLTALVSSGTFDGNLHKAQICIPKVNRNGSKNDSSSREHKLIQLFTSLLQSDDDTLLKQVKQSVHTKKMKQILNVDENQKQILYKKIRSINELNLFQKLLIYRKLGICFQLSEEWHKKMVDYIRQNTLDDYKIIDLTKELHCLNLKSRFKAKYKIDKYIKRKRIFETNQKSILPPLENILKSNKKSKPRLSNGFVTNDEDPMSGKSKLPPMPSTPLVQKVLFCTGDFAHLVIACTDNRLLIWNLLTLRLQDVLKLSTEQIAIDPQTNLVSVFTKNRELHIFSPRDAITLYFRANMPRVLGAVWLPKQRPRPQSVLVNWQSRSTLYFLTDKQEIMYLGTNDETEIPLTAFNEDAKMPTQYTTFGAYATNQHSDTKSNELPERGVLIGVHGKSAVKELLEMSTQTMPPMNLLVTDFLRSFVKLKPKDDKSSKESKNKVENMELDSSDDEDSTTKLKKSSTNLEEITVTNSSVDYQSIDKNLYKYSAETIEIEF